MLLFYRLVKLVYNNTLLKQVLLLFSLLYLFFSRIFL